jgi:hypothetical protein
VARGRFGNPGDRKRLPLEAWKPLPRNGSEVLTLDISLCMIVVCIL